MSCLQCGGGQFLSFRTSFPTLIGVLGRPRYADFFLMRLCCFDAASNQPQIEIYSRKLIIDNSVLLLCEGTRQIIGWYVNAPVANNSHH